MPLIERCHGRSITHTSFLPSEPFASFTEPRKILVGSEGVEPPSLRRAFSLNYDPVFSFQNAPGRSRLSVLWLKKQSVLSSELPGQVLLLQQLQLRKVLLQFTSWTRIHSNGHELTTPRSIRLKDEPVLDSRFHEVPADVS